MVSMISQEIKVLYQRIHHDFVHHEDMISIRLVMIPWIRHGHGSV